MKMRIFFSQKKIYAVKYTIAIAQHIFTWNFLIARFDNENDDDERRKKKERKNNNTQTVYLWSKKNNNNSSTQRVLSHV